MIRAVRCDQPTFHNVAFEYGLNVVMADRTKESTKTDSRNGLGKSTLIEIIHFCFGSTARRDQGLLVEPLKNWVFSVDFTAQNKDVRVSRSTSNPNVVSIEGDFTDWPIKPELNEESGAMELSIRQWNELLGYLLFGLALGTSEPYVPTFRGVLSFFIRRTRDAYSNPFESHRKQKEADKQIYNTFLLELEWQDAREFQQIKDRKKTLEDLQKASKQGLVKEFAGSRGELEALQVRLSDKARQEQDQLRTFRVHPQYEEITRRADQLTSEIHTLTNENVIDQRYADLYKSTLVEERAPETEEVATVYRKAGVQLPGVVVERLENVQNFHAQLIQNRKQFLQSEIERLERTTTERSRTIETHTRERAQLLEILHTHGALQEYNALSQLHLRTVAELQDVSRRLENLKTLEEGRSRVAIEQETLLQRARRDLEEREEIRNEAIRLFNENSQALYSGAAGSLIIEIQPTGFRFNVEIERSGSQGIENMKVFCYDLTIAELWARRSPSPGFLVHDSTIFDGVDERQVALALELAERKAREAGFQYICTLNSDTVPWREFSRGFDLNSFVRLRLTDATEADRLLGVSF